MVAVRQQGLFWLMNNRTLSPVHFVNRHRSTLKIPCLKLVCFCLHVVVLDENVIFLGSIRAVTNVSCPRHGCAKHSHMRQHVRVHVIVSIVHRGAVHSLSALKQRGSLSQCRRQCSSQSQGSILSINIATIASRQQQRAIVVSSL
jgi:hypothetical protein